MSVQPQTTHVTPVHLPVTAHFTPTMPELLEDAALSIVTMAILCVWTTHTLVAASDQPQEDAPESVPEHTSTTREGTTELVPEHVSAAHEDAPESVPEFSCAVLEGATESDSKSKPDHPDEICPATTTLTPKFLD